MSDALVGALASNEVESSNNSTEFHSRTRSVCLAKRICTQERRITMHTFYQSTSMKIALVGWISGIWFGLSCVSSSDIKGDKVQPMTEKQAVQLADDFIATQTPPSRYSWRFQSVRTFQATYQIQYEKVFKEPTKENPPYDLVIVESNGSVHWGSPE
jgi:hypothetical protein